MNRQVTIYSFDEVSGFRSEVKRQHSEVLYRTGHHESAEGALADARRWMKKNGFVLGPYRVSGPKRLISADSPLPLDLEPRPGIITRIVRALTGRQGRPGIPLLTRGGRVCLPPDFSPPARP
jgi:hypothetical protein